MEAEFSNSCVEVSYSGVQVAKNNFYILAVAALHQRFVEKFHFGTIQWSLSPTTNSIPNLRFFVFRRVDVSLSSSILFNFKTEHSLKSLSFIRNGLSYVRRVAIFLWFLFFICWIPIHKHKRRGFSFSLLRVSKRMFVVNIEDTCSEARNRELLDHYLKE